MNDLKIGQILSSRLCHDLVTPVGAVLSGLELLEENLHNNPGEIIDLLRLSANESSRRLNLLRLCFGSGAAGTFNNLNELKDAMSKSLNPEKFTYEVNFPDSYFAGRPELKTMVQLCANLISISVEAMPYGGHLDLSDFGQDQVQIKLSGKLLPLNEDVKGTLINGSSIDTMTPRNIQAHLCYEFARTVERRIEVAQRGDELYIYTSNS